MITDDKFYRLNKVKKSIADILTVASKMLPGIVLIGPPGAGKTSVGAEIARKCVLRHIDTDNIIESVAGLNIPEIFSAYGEPSFRELEKHILNVCVNAISNNIHAGQQRVVDFKDIKTAISTGGGTAAAPGNFEKLRKLGVVVGLTASVDVLLDRLSSKNNRPLLDAELSNGDAKQKRQALETLLAARAEIYKQAAFTVDTTNLSITKVAEQIEQKLDGCT